jgi:ParB-like chromosome segregation protein Spo0J
MYGIAMTLLAIADILAQRHLDPSRVDIYRLTIARFRPVVVFETEDGLLLADGYHRVAAALREGRETIEAEVRSGTRAEAP